MKKISFTRKELNNIINNKELLIGQGSFGNVYRFGKDDAIKIDNLFIEYKDDLSDNELLDLIYKKKADDKKFFHYELDKQQALLDSKRENIKNTSIASGIGYLSDVSIALITKYHKGYWDLNRFKLTPTERMRVFKRKMELHQELTQNGIYHLDAVYDNNILYRPSDGDIQLIDMDGPLLIVCKEPNLIHQKEIDEKMIKSYNMMIKSIEAESKKGKAL